MQYFTVTASTTEAELKEQYEKRAKEHHPDKFSNLGPDEEAAAKIRFQDMQQEYFRLILKLREPAIDYDKLKTNLQAIRAGLDAFLTAIGKKPTGELLPDQASALLGKIKFPPFLEQYKPMVQMIILPNANPEQVIDIMISVFKSFNTKK